MPVYMTVWETASEVALGDQIQFTFAANDGDWFVVDRAGCLAAFLHLLLMESHGHW